MRMLGGLLVWVVATLLGLIAAAGLSGAGLGWADGFIKRSFWEDGESEIGIGLSIFGLVVGGSTRARLRGSGAEVRREGLAEPLNTGAACVPA